MEQILHDDNTLDIYPVQARDSKEIRVASDYLNKQVSSHDYVAMLYQQIAKNGHTQKSFQHRQLRKNKSSVSHRNESNEVF